MAQLAIAYQRKEFVDNSKMQFELLNPRHQLFFCILYLRTVQCQLRKKNAAISSGF